MAGENNANHLPPGFRFYPTDEELVVHFLQRKASLLPCHPDIIPDIDLYPHDPWDLDGKAMVEGNMWYFFSRKVENRITNSGCWRPLGLEEAVLDRANKKVGTKKQYVFYLGEEASSGTQTNWIMQEYSLPDRCSSSKSSKRRGKPKVDWVLCRVYEQNCDDKGDGGPELSCLDEVFLSLDDLDEISLPR